MCIVCGFESRCLSTISSNIPFDLKAIIFQKNFDFSELPPNNLPSLLWTWRISPWFLDISRYQCWQPQQIKLPDYQKFSEYYYLVLILNFSGLSNGSENGTTHLNYALSFVAPFAFCLHSQFFETKTKQFFLKNVSLLFPSKNPALHFWNLGFITTSFYVTWKMVCPSIQDSFAWKKKFDGSASAAVSPKFSVSPSCRGI